MEYLSCRTLLSVTMSSPRTTRAPRFRASLGLALFLAIIVVAPVWAAMSLCAMPCCHHASPVSPILKAEMPCTTNCTVTRNEEVKESDATQLPASPDAALTTAPATDEVFAAPVQPPVRSAFTAAPSPDRALHLVNSVFLI